MFVQCQILCEVSIHRDRPPHNTLLTTKCKALGLQCHSQYNLNSRRLSRVTILNMFSYMKTEIFRYWNWRLIDLDKTTICRNKKLGLCLYSDLTLKQFFVIGWMLDWSLSWYLARCLTPFWQILIGLSKKALCQLSFHWFPQIFVAYEQKINIKVCVNLQIILSGFPKSLLSTCKKQRTKFT